MERWLVELSKTVSQALRHKPWLYELELDNEGWVDLEVLLRALRKQKSSWSNLSRQDLDEMIEKSSKKRHQILGNKIRALYGHSLENKLIKKTGEPPDKLFHGTSPKVIPSIKTNGLLPMSRQYVHLSVDQKTAIEVGYRKTLKPVILTINAKLAYKNGIKFYVGNEHVWLADNIPSEYITNPSNYPK